MKLDDPGAMVGAPYPMVREGPARVEYVGRVVSRPVTGVEYRLDPPNSELVNGWVGRASGGWQRWWRNPRHI